jgi:hypothetical protein
LKRRWLRRHPGPRERALAAGVALGAAVGVGAVVFYLTRLLLSREEMEPLREAGDAAGALPTRKRQALPPTLRS